MLYGIETIGGWARSDRCRSAAPCEDEQWQPGMALQNLACSSRSQKAPATVAGQVPWQAKYQCGLHGTLRWLPIGANILEPQVDVAQPA